MATFKMFVTVLALGLVQIVNASTIKRWGVPLPACTPNTPFVYAGCFSDPNGTALEYRSEVNYNNMTVAACVDFCKGNDYRYAGLEYYGECFCGATVSGALSPASNCAAPCTGNSSEICGGNSYISIYQDPTFPAVDNTVITDYHHVGCYSEGVGGRALEYQQNLNTTTITVEDCLFSCKQGGFAFAGVEDASQCFCSVVLGNGSVPLAASQCSMPCNGNTTELCGGAATIDIYVAPDLESDQPCGYVSVSSSSSSSSTPPPTTSTPPPTTSTQSTSSKPPTTTSTPCTTSNPPTTTTTPSRTPSLCTSTVTISPSPTCEYQCGKWCSNPLPPFSDKSSCTTAASQCAVQVFSCFMNAGWPASQDCRAFSSWCSSVSNYCGSSCPGGSCSLSSCKGKYPPSGPSQPSPTISTKVYTCSPTTSAKPTTSVKPTTSSCVPIPTQSCICTQPSNPGKGYTSTSPVGSIHLPCLTCNNLYSDFSSGNWFKLYTSSNSATCPSYGKGSVQKGCQDSCDYQKQVCLNTYAESCKSNTAYQIQRQGYDSYSSACTKCENQWNDCYWQNNGVSAGNRCTSWNSGWY